MLFEEIVKETNLLLEAKFNEDIIKTAIENCVQISLVYNDKKGGPGKSWRYVCPVVYGKWQHGNTNRGKMAIRAFQLGGSSKRGKKKNFWKVFFADSDHIRGIELLRDEKTGDYLTFSEEDLKSKSDIDDKEQSIKSKTKPAILNKNSDKYISPIIYSVPFVNVGTSVKTVVPKSDIDGKEQPTEPKIEPAIPTQNVKMPTVGQPTQNKPVQSLDNSEFKTTLSNKEDGDEINAPSTHAMTKTDIEGPKEPNEIPQVIKPQEKEPEISDTSIDKDDVDNGENNKEIVNDITPKFQDLMERWTRLDKKEKFIL